MSVLPACVSEHHMYAWCLQRSEEGTGYPGTDLYMFVSRHRIISVDTENEFDKIKLAFILNVVIDSEKKVINAFAGDSEKAHLTGCEHFWITHISNHNYCKFI